MSIPSWILTKAAVLQASQQVVTHGPIPSAPATTGGMLGPIIDVVILIIVTLQSFTGSWGLAIMLTALIVKLLLFRLSIAQYTGMAWMQVLAPMQKQLTEHFKGDKETANRKVMELYQELKINPLSGCLPLMIQLPIFFAVFRALYNPDIFGSAKFLGIHLMYSAMPAMEMGRYPGMDKVINLSQPGVVNFLLGGNQIFLYLPAFSIVIAYIATSLFYQHQMKVVQKRIPKYDFGGNGEPPKQPFNPNFMMILVVVFGLLIPAGAMLYFITQNLFSIFEYNYIMNNAIAAIKSRDLEAMYKSLISKEPKQAAKPTEKPLENSPESSASGQTNDKETVQEGDTISAGGDSGGAPSSPKRNRRKR